MKSPFSWDTNHVAHWKLTDVLEEHVLSITRFEEKPNKKSE
jgi:hypothetical protein